MNDIFLEIGIVLALILLNGFFAGTEMAFISLRKTRIKQLAREGKKSAQLAEKMLQKPEDFLATIQVGITLIGTFASVFAGASIADALAPIVGSTPISFITNNASVISFLIVVITITYASLIIGELIPKSLGIKFSERFAFTVAYPIHALSRIVRPVTVFLTMSSNFVLKFFGDKTSFSEASLTEEELRTILYESHKAGTIKKYEHELLDNVFDFSDIAVSQVMTPRSKMFAVDVNKPFDNVVQEVIESGYTRIPVYQEKIDNILGILNIKSLLKNLAEKKSHPMLSDLLQEPHFVPNTRHISDLLKTMQKEKVHMAIVTDEYGDVDGVVTIEDILEEIVGDISDESDEERSPITSMEDGSYEVDGDISIVDFNRYFKSHLPEDASYTTISGLLMEAFEVIADVGAKTVVDHIEFTITKRTDRMIKAVSVRFLVSTNA